MKRLICLSFTLLFLTGCWTGGPLRQNQIAYKHGSVLWVYKTGAQIGVWGGFLLTSVSNDLLDLQPGDDCVHVKEGQTGGQCSAAPQASLAVSHVLDLRTGRPAFAHGSARPIKHPQPICRADLGHWETPVDDQLSVYSAGETGRLYLCLPSELLILHVCLSDMYGPNEPFLGVPIAAFRMPNDLLVIGLSQGYIVCIDMRKLPSGQDG